MNTSSAPRTAMHSAFVRRQVSHSDGHSYEGAGVSPEVYARLAQTERGRAVIALLDVEDPAPLLKAAAAAAAADCPKLRHTCGCLLNRSCL